MVFPRDFKPLEDQAALQKAFSGQSAGLKKLMKNKGMGLRSDYLPLHCTTGYLVSAEAKTAKAFAARTACPGATCPHQIPPALPRDRMGC